MVVELRMEQRATLRLEAVVSVLTGMRRGLPLVVAQVEPSYCFEPDYFLRNCLYTEELTERFVVRPGGFELERE